MLHCLWLPAALAVALAGANEDIGVKKGGRGVVSKPASRLSLVTSLPQP